MALASGRDISQMAFAIFSGRMMTLSLQERNFCSGKTDSFGSASNDNDLIHEKSPFIKGTNSEKKRGKKEL